MPLIVRLALILTLALPLAGCDDPCEELEAKVCRVADPRLKRQYDHHCKLMQEPLRRKNLPAKACESMLEHLSKR